MSRLTLQETNQYFSFCFLFTSQVYKLDDIRRGYGISLQIRTLGQFLCWGGVGGGLSGLNFSQLKSEVFHFQMGEGGGVLWSDIPLTREGLSVKIGNKFCAQQTACVS